MKRFVGAAAGGLAANGTVLPSEAAPLAAQRVAPAPCPGSQLPAPRALQVHSHAATRRVFLYADGAARLKAGKASVALGLDRHLHVGGCRRVGSAQQRGAAHGAGSWGFAARTHGSAVRRGRRAAAAAGDLLQRNEMRREWPSPGDAAERRPVQCAGVRTKVTLTRAWNEVTMPKGRSPER